MLDPLLTLSTSIVDKDIFDDNLTTAFQNVLFIDSAVEDFQQYANANTFPIVYNRMTSREQILEILTQNFRHISRIGLVCHFEEQPYFLNNELLFSDVNTQFMIDLIKQFNVINLDYLACRTLQNQGWKDYFTKLHNATGIPIGASDDNTGNLPYGGNWILESTQEDIQTIYFNDQIVNYSSLLTSVTVNGLEDTSNIEITFVKLCLDASYTDVDGSLNAFIVKSIANNGLLKIGTSPTTANSWDVNTNNIIDASHSAYWTPAPNEYGLVNAFKYNPRHNSIYTSNIIADLFVDVIAVNDIPILASVLPIVLPSINSPQPVFEDASNIEISFVQLCLDASYSDIDGSVNAFIVTSVTNNGLLKIGSTTTPWLNGSNCTIDASHSAYWTPTPNANGLLNAFKIAARDNSMGQSTTQFDVNIYVTPVNDAPIITIGTSILTGTVSDSNLNAQGTMYATDVDTSSNLLRWDLSGSLTQTSGYGIMSINATTGAWTYDLSKNSVNYKALKKDASYNDIFTVSVTDGSSNSIQPQTLSIKVIGINDPPTVSSTTRSVSVIKNTTSLTGTTDASDVDLGTSLSYDISGSKTGTYGTIDISSNTGAWRYDLSSNSAAFKLLANDASDNDMFTIRVSDGSLNVTQTLTIKVIGINDPPTVSSTQSKTLTKGETFLTGSTDASDVDLGAALTYTIPNNIGTYGTIDISSNTGAWRYNLSSNSDAYKALANDVSANDIFTINVSDGSLNVTQSLTIKVIGNITTTTIIINTTPYPLLQNQPGVLTYYNTSVLPTPGDSYVLKNAQGSIVSNPYICSQISTSDFVSSGLHNPRGITFDSIGNLYIANYTDLNILKITPDGVSSIFSAGNLIIKPFFIAFDSSGYLYVVNGGPTNTICKISPDGTQSPFITSGLSYPIGIAIDVSDNLYVSTNDSSTTTAILKFRPDGTSFGAPFATSFVSAQTLFGMAFDSIGNLYVASSIGTVFKITPDGTKSTFVSGLNGAYGLTFDKGGNLYISNSTSTVYKVPVNTTIANTFVAIQYPMGLAFDQSGNLYTANSTINKITKIKIDIPTTFTFSNVLLNTPGQNELSIYNTSTSTTISSLSVKVNNTPTISGDNSGNVWEDGSLNVTGILTAVDADISDNLTWDISGSNSNAYGVFTIITSSGINNNNNNNNTCTWRYDLSNNSPSVQSLKQGQKIIDTFYIRVQDNQQASAFQTVTITINGTNDTPTISGDISGNVSEDGILRAQGVLTAVDVDLSGNFTWDLSGNGISNYGRMNISSGVTNNNTCAWSYDLSNNSSFVQALSQGQTITDKFYVIVRDDVSANAVQLVTITINGKNDPIRLLNKIPNQAIDMSSNFSYVIPSTTFLDVDVSDNLTYSVVLSSNTPIPSWLHFEPSTRTFTSVSNRTTVGPLKIKVTATDGLTSAASAYFIINVISQQAISGSVLDGYIKFGTITARDLSNNIVGGPVQSDESGKFSIPIPMNIQPSTSYIVDCVGGTDIATGAPILYPLSSIYTSGDISYVMLNSSNVVINPLTTIVSDIVNSNIPLYRNNLSVVYTYVANAFGLQSSHIGGDYIYSQNIADGIAAIKIATITKILSLSTGTDINTIKLKIATNIEGQAGKLLFDASFISDSGFGASSLILKSNLTGIVAAISSLMDAVVNVGSPTDINRITKQYKELYKLSKGALSISFLNINTIYNE